MSASDRRRLNLCFVGWGAIARRVGELLSERHPHGVNIVAVAVRDHHRQRQDLPAEVRLISEPGELAGLDIDMVIEAAGRDAVAVWGEAALRYAASFIVSSTSAFCDDTLLDRLVSVAKETGSRIVVPSGAWVISVRWRLPASCRWRTWFIRSSNHLAPGAARRRRPCWIWKRSRASPLSSTAAHARPLTAFLKTPMSR
ncbi:hypothetical protein [Mesorhizobium amorphae]|uniref:hypothetical protein n=1 Tax=Mesorhizobium amorphae TaxID=71433 RepID=UPI00391FC5D6